MASKKLIGFKFFFIKSKYVAGLYPKFLGVAVSDQQVRVGLIWWHIGVIIPDSLRRN